MSKKPKPARGKAFGILNPYGDLWTYNHFPSEAAARQHVVDFWNQPGFRGSKSAGEIGRYQIVPVRVTVSALPPPPARKQP